LLRCPAGHKAWKTGCRTEQRQLEETDRLIPLLGALAIVAIRLLGLRDVARRDDGTSADVPETTIRILAAKLQQPTESFTTNRGFLRGVARLGGFLARKSDGGLGWQTIWKSWFGIMILVEGYELAQAFTSPK
jgi:Transposase Tn5 dimerisation domain